MSTSTSIVEQTIIFSSHPSIWSRLNGAVLHSHCGDKFAFRFDNACTALFDRSVQSESGMWVTMDTGLILN